MERLFTTRIAKIGTSHGIIIPKEILAGMMLARGDTVVFSVISGPTLIVRQLSELEMQKIKPGRDIAF